jgi:VWFA-related protein
MRYIGRVAQQLAVVLALVASLLLSGTVGGFQQPRFRSRALAVRVDVLVTDGRKPVAGLSAADFELRDNGVIQAVEVINAADVPLNIVLALDTSASTEGKRQADLIVASQALLDGLNPVDRAALTTFSHAVTPAGALTSDLAAVRKALLRITPSGRTAVMDGVYVALAATLAQPGRSLVVVYTDASDISSWLEPREVIESARRSSAVVYAVTTADARRVASLEDLTEATGGEMIHVTSSSELRSSFQRILQEFRSRYVLAFRPSGVSLGGLHRLDVRVKRRGLNVTARPGYIGVEPGR